MRTHESATTSRDALRARGAARLLLIGALAVAGLLAAACSDDDGGDRTTPDRDVEADQGTTGGATTGSDTGSGSEGAAPDACELLTPDGIATVLGPGARRPLDVDEPNPLPPRGKACSWAIRSELGGSTFVQVEVGDEFSYELAQTSADSDVEQRSGLGDRAVFVYINGNPSLWTMTGTTAVGLRLGSFDDDWGMSEATQQALLELALAELG